MKKEHKKFIKKLTKFLQQNPEQRITQALYNLGVNYSIPHASTDVPANFVDNYNHADEHVLARVAESLKNIKQNGKRKEKSEAPNS